MNTNIRKAPLVTLADALKAQQTRALDVVVPAQELLSDGGLYVVRGSETILTADGVSNADGLYVPTDAAEGQVAEKLDIPVKYLRRMREAGALDLYDFNVNGWLSRDERSFLVRLLRADGDADTGIGTLRALLSNGYRTIDNFDVLLASLQGIRDAGVVDPQITADLTDRRMYVTVVAPQIKAYAPELLKGYRSPFTGEVDPEGTVFAGFKLTNSETGHGSMSLTPYIEVLICRNGQTIGKAVREVHIGQKLDDGVIKVSDETRETNAKLIRSHTRDAVATFLDAEYVTARLREMEAAAGVKVSDPQRTIKDVSQRLGFTQSQADSILNMFIDGGQRTAGGVMQAVTATAQTLESGDDADMFERKAMQALEIAASLR